jgi:uncharacterized LabA/DUF88 family protein
MSKPAPEKICLFVDVQKIYYTCRQAFKGNFDNNKFWAKVTKNRELVSATAYATEPADDKQAQFQNILRAIGFTVLRKPVLKRKDGSTKADWDVGIALDVYEAAPHCDRIVLASGDGDFTVLLERIRERFDTPSEVYGVTPLTAGALINAATDFFPINVDLLLK